MSREWVQERGPDGLGFWTREFIETDGIGYYVRCCSVCGARGRACDETCKNCGAEMYVSEEDTFA